VIFAIALLADAGSSGAKAITPDDAVNEKLLPPKRRSLPTKEKHLYGECTFHAKCNSEHVTERDRRARGRER